MANSPLTPLLTPKHWPTWLAIGLLRLLACLPYPALMLCGRGIGRLVGLFARRRVCIADVNLRLCYPDMSAAQRRRLVGENFAAMGMGLMEVGMGWWWSEQRLKNLLLGIDGEEYLTDDRNGLGTIFLTAHFSSLELSGRFIADRVPSHAMYRPNENPVIQWLFERYRTARTLGIIARDDVRSMIRALRAGQGVWFAPDQNFKHKGGVFADFMGVPAATNTATSRFAQMTGASVVPFVLLRQPGGYRLIVEPPLNDFPGADVQADAQRINDIFARWVALAPAQYNWVHRRFKTQPDQGRSPYA